MHKLFSKIIKTTAMLTLLQTGFASAAPIALKGNFIQGGMVTGSLPQAQSVTLNGTKLKLSKAGDFVFGFGRDAKLDQQLTWTDQQGNQQSFKFSVSKRKYKIDKIEGVAKKYVSPPDSVLARIRNDAKLVKAARAGESSRLDFLSPVYRPATGRISGVYGSQRYFNGTPKRPHFGLDIANKTGTPVYAPLPGKVVLAESDLYYSGGTLILDHGHGITSTYIHLDKLVAKVGQEIKTGDIIANIGATGRVTGPHLDWRFNWQQVRLDPQLLMLESLAKDIRAK